MSGQLLKAILFILVWTASLLCVDINTLGAGSLSVDKPEVQIKEPVTATFYMNYEDCEGGWVGVFVKGTPDTDYFWAKMVTFDENKQIVDNTYTVSFNNPGSYEFRLFEDYFQQRKAATASVEVVFAPTSSISVSSNAVPGNQNVTATYTISERDGIDTGGWIGFYKVGSGDDSWITYQKTGGKSGAFEVTMPQGRDEKYEFRLFMDYFGVWKLATSPTIRAAASDEELNNPVDSKARFNNLNGVVEITPDPDRVEWSGVNLRQVIYVGDHIQTSEDSSAIIQLEDMSTYVLPPNSEIIIMTPPAEETKIGLVTGRIWNNTRKMFIDGTMQVEMGQAVAGIRGTTIVCEENQSVSTLKVIEGEVELTAISGGECQSVTTGEMLSVDAEGFSAKETFDVEAEKAFWEGLGAPAAGEPFAAFIASDTEGEAPLSVDFTDQSIGENNSWSWEFGDGGTSTEQNPSYTYDTAGTYSVSLTINGTGGSDTLIKNDYILITPGEKLEIITPDSLTEGDAKAFYSQTLQIQTGTAPYKWAVKKGSKLPSGLKLKVDTDTSKATLSGKPSKAVDNATFIIQVTDDNETPFEKEYHLHINPAIKLDAPKLPNGEVGFALEDWKPTASGGNDNYTWTITKGRLPTGLTLNPSTGKIEGTPLEYGTFKFTLMVSDDPGGTASKSLSLKVYKALEITTTSLPNGDPGVTYKSTTLKATGGGSAKTWEIIDGKLPNGLDMSPKGAIKGKPALDSSDNYTITVKVSDGAGMDTQVFEFTIYDPLVIDPLPDGVTGEPYSQVLSAKGGSGGYKFSKVGSLPKWLKLNTKTGTLYGTPDAPGSSSFNIKVTDSLKASAVHELEIEVKSALNTALQCPSTGAAPVIDGIISTDEWPDPGLTTQLNFYNTVSLENEIHTLVFYSMHDDNNLYIAAKITDTAFQPGVPPAQGQLCVDVFEIYFDGNNDGVIEPNSDIKNFWNLNYGDWHYSGNGVWRTDNVNNGSGLATHTNPAGIGDYIYEFLIPLDSGDEQDLEINSNSTTGIMLSFRKMWWNWDEDTLQWVYSFAGQDAWPEDALNHRFEGSTYGSLELIE